MPPFNDGPAERWAGQLLDGQGWASDNDGLWTGMLLMAQSYRFAVTRDATARAEAWRSVRHHKPTTHPQPQRSKGARVQVRALEFLHNVTGTPGFSARSAVKCGDSHGGGDSTPCHAP